MLSYILNFNFTPFINVVKKYITNDIEEGLEEQIFPYDFNIPDCYSTQEELDQLV